MFYFISPFYFRVPFNLKDYFPNKDRFSIEIGFGRGDFTLYLAEKEQEYGYLGIEISSRSVLKLVRRAIKNNAENIKAIKIDAFLLFSIIEPAFSVDRIIYNFPDPWPHNRERRVTYRNHLLLIHRVLKKDGNLYIATDSDILKEDIEKNTKGLFLVEKREKPYFTFKTKYEKKWISERRNINYYRLTPMPYNSNYPVLNYEGDGKMAHVIFKKKGKINDIKLSLPKRLRPKDDMLIMLQSPYKRNGEYLFPILVKEKGFVQKAFFKLYLKGDEARFVIDDTGYLVVTDGIKRAMAYIRDMLLDTGNFEVIRDTT